VRRLRSNIWRQKNWLLHHENAPSHASVFIMEFLTQNSMTVDTIHPNFLFSRFEIKLKGLRFDTTEVIEAES
jgi:hypothetical protein